MLGGGGGGGGVELVMKYNILHVSRTSTPFRILNPLIILKTVITEALDIL